MIFHALIVAGGSGSRSGGRKQWAPLGGRAVLDWSVEAFAAAGATQIVVVVPADDIARAEDAYGDRAQIVAGGADRAASVVNGLTALTAEADEIVMIHDAARPLLTTSHIRNLLQSLTQHRAAILALPVTDTLKFGADAVITDTPSRDNLWRAQTPQAFRYGDIQAAYAAWPADRAATDEAMVAGEAGIAVALVPGDMRLHKLTYPEDFALLEALILKEIDVKDIRTGQGFDAHRWGDGDSVWLCGVEIPHDQTLIGHSDADAGLHALTDALLGAAALGDIGDHFPPSDPQWRGVSSDRFLRHAAELIAQRGGRILNVDVTLICERPKIKPHREAMRRRVAEILTLDLDRVSVKATTTEGMGFAGRGEGLAASAVCAIEL
ncbi:MAG: bifunctional 2-C-methyl-D-erythritol 4-phosphate cytidylyltransferase/2-C-methyl-D-erythritol 2,4-cyclodiphosphate synthase [Asticcacaulis sp.]|uniref:bifunctional 2-C-methyl-D-erythritol 4-phosphate cytidylyltransferase/2-C-methyl-D-erythritol 2,4-cyclodiphosphate synthase n=1 Tax=Asticcacaulis sp. TaxID=1872648 RepID=UPI003F7B64A1